MSAGIWNTISGAVPKSDVNIEKSIKDYMEIHNDSQENKLEERKSNYTTMVNNYYDLVTDFYEYGWGECFHFAPRHYKETFNESVARHEYWLAHQLDLQEGMRCMDLGCGVGGPMRNIARFTQAKVTGVNNNAYQIRKATQHNIDAELDHLCDFVKTDFMKLPFEDNTFDRIYDIESGCHAPDKTELFKGLYRVLKPGGMYAGYQWVMTDKYNEEDPKHREIKKGIEVGDGLPDLWSIEYSLECMKEAGFEIVFETDRALDSQIPWYESLSPSWSLGGFRRTWLGRMTTTSLVSLLETCYLAPKGTTETSNMLNAAADYLVAGGETGTFTPMHFVLIRKPE